jgi:hypothetical protein
MRIWKRSAKVRRPRTAGQIWLWCVGYGAGSFLLFNAIMLFIPRLPTDPIAEFGLSTFMALGLTGQWLSELRSFQAEVPVMGTPAWKQAGSVAAPVALIILFLPTAYFGGILTFGLPPAPEMRRWLALPAEVEIGLACASLIVYLGLTGLIIALRQWQVLRLALPLMAPVEWILPVTLTLPLVALVRVGIDMTFDPNLPVVRLMAAGLAGAAGGALVGVAVLRVYRQYHRAALAGSPLHSEHA